MARKATPAASVSAIKPAAGALVSADAAKHGELVTERERVLADVDRRFGLDQPYDLNAYVSHARDAVAVISGRLFVLGRIFIAIKEHEAHGGFQTALERIGVAPRFARKCMAAALKFEGTDAKRMVATSLTHSKLLELLAEDDENIEALGEGGTLAGYTLDEIDSMSTRELREALRKERQEGKDELAARDEIIARKDEKLHKLELKNRKAAKLPIREQGDELLREMLARVATFTAAADDLKTAVEAIKTLFYDAGEDVPADIAEQIDFAAELGDSRASDLRTSCEA